MLYSAFSFIGIIIVQLGGVSDLFTRTSKLKDSLGGATYRIY